MSTLRVNTLQNASGVEVYTAKAWVNFNGTGTVAIRASGNVSSITDNGVGDYTVNFTSGMVDANYAPVMFAGDGAGGRAMCDWSAAATPVAGSVRFRVVDLTTTVDRSYISVAIFR